MVISKKIDYRKRTKRENFFGIPFLPLAIFLLLIIVLFIIPPIEWHGSDTTPGITGKVVSGLSLDKIMYQPDKPLDGDLNLNFYWGDLIAHNASVTFDITSVKCKNYYVCGSDGYPVPWERYNFSSGYCENVTSWVYGPWDECGEDKYYEYPNSYYPDLDCDEIDKECCNTGEGLGKFYANINCGSGKECWDDCKITTERTLIETVALSSTPWKGNFTYGFFKNVNQSFSKKIKVWGFGACPQMAPVPPNVTYPVTYAISGYAMQQQPVPDFDVINIYTSTYVPSQPALPSTMAVQSPVQPTEKLYTQIKNLGGAAGFFSVVGCWDKPGTIPTPLMGQVKTIPTNCFFVNRINMGSGETKVLDMGNWNVKGKTVWVKADYYNEISESNETNNEMTKYFPEVVPLKPDLIVTNLQRKQYNSIEGVKVSMMNIGNAPVSNVRSFFLKVIYYIGSDRWEQEYQIQNPGYMPNQPFTFDVTDKDISGDAVDVTAYVDSRYNVDESNETNNDLSKWLSPYSCENWNNIYEIVLEDFGLRAPDYENTYILKTSLVFDSAVLTYDEVYFEVEEEEPTHNICDDQECVEVSGAGNDQCQTNSDCTQTCNENWQYGPWSECIGGKKRRECYDVNNCSSTYNKPTYCLIFQNKYYQSEDCCVSEWECDEWSVCYNHQGENIQSMTCRDLNECNAQNFSYTQLRDCCIEEWDCRWSACINTIQEKICEDVNYCGTEFTKPAPETRECEKVGISWWVWLIIILVLVAVILAILIGTGRLPWFKKKPKEEIKIRKYPELESYIKKAADKGMSKEKIRERLIRAGWPEKIVREKI